MFGLTRELEVVRVSQTGRATIPKSMREKFGVDTSEPVCVYGDGGRIVVEPVSSQGTADEEEETAERLDGIHAD